MAERRTPGKSDETRRPPATTPEARENQLISLAYDEAERVIKSGKATSQLLTHFLKMGTARESLERMKLQHENELLKAKADQMAQSEKMEQLLDQAIRAFKGYQGAEEDEFYA